MGPTGWTATVATSSAEELCHRRRRLEPAEASIADEEPVPAEEEPAAPAPPAAPDDSRPVATSRRANRAQSQGADSYRPAGDEGPA